jgi:peptide/nickel transport system ATP-binding protein
MSDTPLVSVKGLNVRFGEFHAVRNVSFSVDEGASFGLVGESGSGKSTILRAIMGLAPCTVEQAAVGPHSLDGKRDKSFCRRVQMVFQDPYGSIHPRHSIDRILSEPLAIHKIDNAEARVVSALSDVGLGPSFRFRYPHQLSGGQRQRVAIARAIITEPRILLLDEPTSALDVSVQSEILNLLDDLRRERNLTYILVSHNLAVVAHMCSRVAIMTHGQLVEEVTSAKLHEGCVNDPYSRDLIEASRGYKTYSEAA